MIYLAKAGQYYKIGHSGRVSARIEDLQSANAEAVDLVGRWRGTSDTEALLHDQFSEKRVRGEWFDLDDSDIQWIHDFFTPSGTIIHRIGIKEMGCWFCARRPIMVDLLRSAIGCVHCDDWLSLETYSAHPKKMNRVNAVRCWYESQFA